MTNSPKKASELYKVRLIMDTYALPNKRSL